MTLTTVPPPRPSAPRARPRRSLRSVVVGLGADVDGCAALAWAADDATRTASALLVLDCVGTGAGAPTRGAAIARTLAGSPVAGRLRCVRGAPEDALLAAGDHGDLLVLGRAGEMLGLDAVPVVQRSLRPVVVVPDEWTPQPHEHPALVLVGLGAVGGTLAPDQRRTLATALVVAARRAATVTVVADWRPYATGTARDLVLTRFRRREALVLEAVRQVSAGYPGITVGVDVPVADGVAAVLQRAPRAAIVVLPRGAGSPSATLRDRVGLWECLDRSPVPVLVVP